MSTLSIDLAYKRHADIGVALLERGMDGRIRGTGLKVDVTDPPDVDRLAEWIAATAVSHDVRCLCIDGPLGWQADDTVSRYGAMHSRWCERQLNAPGKTGLPNTCKPALYLPFIRFSIELGARLVDRGWTLATEADAKERVQAPSTRVLCESFPTSAWRALGLKPLPGKSKVGRDQTVLTDAQQTLCHTLDLELSAIRTHDELQAVVGGLAGVWFEAGMQELVQFVGAPPFQALDGTWREGYIIVPAVSPAVPA